MGTNTQPSKNETKSLIYPGIKTDSNPSKAGGKSFPGGSRDNLLSGIQHLETRATAANGSEGKKRLLASEGARAEGVTPQGGSSLSAIHAVADS